MAKVIKKAVKTKTNTNPVKQTLKKIGKKPAPPRKAAAKAVTANKRSVKRAKTANAKKTASQKAAVKKVAPNKIVAKPAARSSRPAGVPEQLRDAALKILDERQAEDIVSVNMEGRSSLADYVIIASGRASRQIAAIAHYLSEAFEALGVKPVRIEGVAQGDWVLVDGGDVIVHLFKPEVRSYYNIETIWDARPQAR